MFAGLPLKSEWKNISYVYNNLSFQEPLSFLVYEQEVFDLCLPHETTLHLTLDSCEKAAE